MHLNDLPDHLLLEIIFHTRRSAALVHLSLTCRRMQRLCRIPCWFQTLYYASIPETILWRRIRQTPDLVRLHPEYRRFAHHMTADAAVSLTNRILALPEVAIPADCSGLPDSVVAAVEAILDGPEFQKSVLSWSRVRPYDTETFCVVRERVRSRYPPPFNRVYPHNAVLAHFLMRSFPRRPDHPLANARTLLELRRFHICFYWPDFLQHVELSAESVPDVIPLICARTTDDFLYVFDHMRSRGSCSHMQQLFRIPLLTYYRRSDPSFRKSMLVPAIYLNEVAMFSYLINVPHMNDVVNHTNELNTHTLLQHALKVKQIEIAIVLLKVPRINLYKKSKDRRARLGAFDFIFGTHPDDGKCCVHEYHEFLHSTEFMNIIVSDLPKFVRNLRPYLERVDNSPVKDYLRQSSFVQHARSYLETYQANCPAIDPVTAFPLLESLNHLLNKP